MAHDQSQLDPWRRLLDGSSDSLALLEAVGSSSVNDVAAITRLRRRWDAEIIRIAIELTRARAKAAEKFPDASGLAVDVEGVEQATPHVVAAHKALRFAALDDTDTVTVHDLCCGIGGDAMALARVADVKAVDDDPIRAWMAGVNAACASRVADVERLDLETELAGVFHLDPSRRVERTGSGTPRRRWRYEDYRPGPDFVERLLRACPDGAVKLGPGIDLTSIDVGPGCDREIEVISLRGKLNQAVLWCGRLARAPGQRTATKLPQGISFTGAPRPVPLAPSASFERFLVLADPALERLELVGSMATGMPVREVHAGLGVMTSPEPLDSPWFRTYRVLDQRPWRLEKLRDHLAELGAGPVVVKTRGGAVDTDRAQRELRGAGDRSLVVFGLRLGHRVVAVVTEPEGSHGA